MFVFVNENNTPMKKSYIIKGMTCNGCVASVEKALLGVAGVTRVEVYLEKGEVDIFMTEAVSLSLLNDALPNKFTIAEKMDFSASAVNETQSISKLRQLKPLLLIFLYLFSAAILLHFKQWNTQQAMLDFMGMFYIVFSFFKFLDLKGFPASFRMYDPLAKVVPAYGWLYPFIELGLGLMFLLRFQIVAALVMTVLVLGITTIGVLKTLLDKKNIQCACLGTALKLPMTEATLIENAIMLLMAVAMLVARFA